MEAKLCEGTCASEVDPQATPPQPHMYSFWQILRMHQPKHFTTSTVRVACKYETRMQPHAHRMQHKDNKIATLVFNLRPGVSCDDLRNQNLLNWALWQKAKWNVCFFLVGWDRQPTRLARAVATPRPPRRPNEPTKPADPNKPSVLLAPARAAQSYRSLPTAF